MLTASTQHIIADLSPYWSWPPTGGGPLRIYNLNRVVSEEAQVVQFSARPTLGHRVGGYSRWIGSRRLELTPNYSEFQYFHPVVLGASYLLYRIGLHSDIFLSTMLNGICPHHLRYAVNAASIVQVEHPWLIGSALKLARDRPIIYVAHNVEAELWEGVIGIGASLFPRLTGRPGELERQAVQHADIVVSMSATDSAILVDRYGVSPEKLHIIPNGVDTDRRKPATPEQKAAARWHLNLDERPVLLFIGSDHYPNKEALSFINQWQSLIGDHLGGQIMVVGSVGEGLQSSRNIRFTGYVENVTNYLMAADIALNPLTRGSGTSLKTVEFLACGLPMIATATGIRGLNLEHGNHVLVGDIEEFPRLIQRLLADGELRLRLSANGRTRVEQEYSWRLLGKRLLRIYDRVRKCEFA